MKLKLIIVLLPVLCVLVLTTVVLAQDEVPAPYKGLTNPFAWDDADARIAGRNMYLSTCIGCHGDGGKGIGVVEPIAVDLSTDYFHETLEEQPDLVFWTVSEGRAFSAMPVFKETLSVTERWQILTYLWSLWEPPPASAPPPAAPVLPPEPVAPPPAPVPPPEPVAPPPAPVPPPEPVAPPPAPVLPPEPVAPLPAPVLPPEPVAPPPVPVPPPEPVAPPAAPAGGIGCGAPARASDSIGAGKLDISFILGGAVFLLLRFVGQRRF